MMIWASEPHRRRDGLEDGSVSAATMFMVGGIAVGRLVGLGSGLAVGTAPFVLGLLPNAVGPATGLLLVPTLLAVAALAVYASRWVEPA